MSQKTLKNRAVPVAEAITAWKRHRNLAESLTPAGRERVLQEGVQSPGPGNLPRLSILFPSYRRIALAAALPTGLLALVIALSLGGGAELGPDPQLSHSAITVEKVGNQVVFTIANGSTEHSVSKSNSPRSFDPGNAVQVQNGSYRDSMIENGDLVFYRID